MYHINKGVGRPLDFFGLKNQYILIFVIGIIFAFISFFIFKYINDIVGVIVAGTIALAAYIISNILNKKYGVNGLGEKLAMNMCPERISPKKAKNLVKFTSRKK